MPVTRGAILNFSLVSAVVVFCIVQDRVVADGTRRYVELQRAALSGTGAPVEIDTVLLPAVRRSVRDGAVWAGTVLGLGAVTAFTAGRRSGKKAPGT